MEAQLKYVTKEEAHQLIDTIKGDTILVLTYNEKKGISDNGKRVKKKTGLKMVDKAKVLVLSSDNPVKTLKLYNRYFKDFGEYKREGVIKSILLPPKLE